MLKILFKVVHFSLKLGHFSRRGGAKVQEKGSFLFGEEGGGGDVVDSSGNMVQLQITKTTSVVPAVLLGEPGGSRVARCGHCDHLETNAVLSGPSELDEQRSRSLQVDLVDGVVFVRVFIVSTASCTRAFPLPVDPFYMCKWIGDL